MTCKSYMGIDPGESGAIAIQSDIYGVRVVSISKLPTTKDIFDYLLDLAVEHEKDWQIFCMIEKVHAMPKQGVASSCRFCRNAGILEGIIVSLGIPHEFIPPAKWQRYLSCLSGGNKNVTKAKAQQLFPEIKITHAIADALLISEYCKRQMNIKSVKENFL